jgi:hypothetical protein
MQGAGIYRGLVSISHDHEYATAYVSLEGEPTFRAMRLARASSLYEFVVPSASASSVSAVSDDTKHDVLATSPESPKL